MYKSMDTTRNDVPAPFKGRSEQAGYGTKGAFAGGGTLAGEKRGEG